MKQRFSVLILTFIVAIVAVSQGISKKDLEKAEVAAAAQSDGYIKYIDFTPTSKVMSDCLEVDTSTYKSENHIGWITLLALLSSEYYGDFGRYSKSRLDSLVNEINQNGVESAIKNRKLYDYYLEAYTAVLGGMVGEYTEVTVSEDGSETRKKCYGLRVFSPIASGYYYSDYDDFGASRSYGYKRSHLGHDLLGSVGTPIIATESGYIEHLGWNMYGGWRIGIRSYDGQRYYYYAHLRSGHPYAADLYEGKQINAGEVIGYLGMTGYSRKEDTNGIDTPHLHYGLQIIFDESQIDGYNQIWCDMYALCEFLTKNRAKTYVKDKDRYSRVYYEYPETPD